MARELYESEPVFRDVIDRCCDALDAAGIEQDLRPYLLWDPQHSTMDAAQAGAALAQTQFAQPAIFAMEMALATLLGSWGIRPDMVMGHSVGEFAGACLADVFALEDAMRLVAARGRLMQAQPAGKMLAVRAPADQVQALLPPAIAIAAINSPGLTVVSGASAEVDAFAEMLSGNGIAATMLVTSHAYHSAMMAPARAPLVEAVAAVPRKPAALSIVSTALARAVAPDALCDPAYWGEQLMSPVRFADSVAAAPDAGVLLEVGPGRTLATLARQCLGGRAGRAPVACLGPVQAPGSDVASLLSAVGQLWLAGAMPDWEAFQPGRRIRVALPTYPFERKRFWVQPMQMDTGAAAPAGGNHATAALPGAAVAAPEAGFATDVEQLIQQQLLLISEQIGAMAKAGTDDK